MHPDRFAHNCLERGELPGVPPSGGRSGSDYPFMREQLLDRHDLEYAVHAVTAPRESRASTT